MDNNENKNQENNINFQNMIDNNNTPSINDVLLGNVSVNNNNNDIQSNVDNVVEKDLGEKQKNSSSCSYCECCGRLIDNEGNLLGIDGDNKDLLINAFIGKNADEIRIKKFSVSTFLFGYFYFAYRKMYANAFLVLLFESLFIPLVSFNLIFKINDIFRIIFFLVLLLAFRIFLSIKFRNIYLKFIENEINFYEKRYNYYLDNILLVCKKNGGTNIFSFVIYLVCLIFSWVFWFLVLAMRSI